jgi:tetratricopeptide (TPR) repeat protein
MAAIRVDAGRRARSLRSHDLRRRVLAAIPLLAWLSACGSASSPAPPPSPIEARSLLGEPLRRPALTAEREARLVDDLREATADFAARPGDAEAAIWVGRRLAYLGRYREAVDVFDAAIRRHPRDPRLYRHRGHRWITLRELDRAVTDLSHGARLVAGLPDEVEPDGAPNPYGIPTSTLQTNLWYHLGLAHYLRGEFEAAADAFQRCLALSGNDDMRVATADWLYMTLRRLGRDGEARAVLAPIRREMRILENHAYHRRLLMYRGELPPDSLLASGAGDPLQAVTQGYGVGNWYLYGGDTTRAVEIFRQVLAVGNWPAFGHIAAEAELARLGLRPR